MTEHSEWLGTVKAVFDKHLSKGGFQVLFPEYRPDLSRALANYLELEFYDYRKEKMLTEGWRAGEISLDTMTSALLEKSTHTGLVVHNIEALLATKSEQERRKWFADFFTIDWPNPIVLPVCIYQADTPRKQSRVCDIRFTEFPKESFLMRLAG